MARVISIEKEYSNGTKETYWSESYLMEKLGFDKKKLTKKV